MCMLFLFADATWDLLALSFQIETPDSSSEGRETKLFPDQHSHDMNITAHALTTDFLIYTSDVSGLLVGDILRRWHSYARRPAYSRPSALWHLQYAGFSFYRGTVRGIQSGILVAPVVISVYTTNLKCFTSLHVTVRSYVRGINILFLIVLTDGTHSVFLSWRLEDGDRLLSQHWYPWVIR